MALWSSTWCPLELVGIVVSSNAGKGFVSWVGLQVLLTSCDIPITVKGACANRGSPRLELPSTWLFQRLSPSPLGGQDHSLNIGKLFGISMLGFEETKAGDEDAMNGTSCDPPMFCWPYRAWGLGEGTIALLKSPKPLSLKNMRPSSWPMLLPYGVRRPWEMELSKELLDGRCCSMEGRVSWSSIWALILLMTPRKWYKWITYLASLPIFGPEWQALLCHKRSYRCALNIDHKKAFQRSISGWFQYTREEALDWTLTSFFALHLRQASPRRRGGPFKTSYQEERFYLCYERPTFFFWCNASFFRTTSLRYWFIFRFGLSFSFWGSLGYDCKGMWLVRVMFFGYLGCRAWCYLLTDW